MARERRTPIPRLVEPLPEDISDEMLDAYFEALARQPMVPTLTGRENEPSTPGRDAVLAAGRGIDHSETATAPPPLADIPRADMTGEGGTEFLESIMRPSAGTGAGPQSATEAEDLARDAAMVGRTAVTGALAVPAGRALQFGGRMAAAASRNPLVVAGGGGSALAAASPGRTDEPSELATTRGRIEELRGQQRELQEQRTAALAEGRQFNSINQENEDEVRRIQRLVGVRPDGNWGEATGKAVERYRQGKRDEVAALDRQLGERGRDLRTAEDRRRSLEGGERLRRSHEDLSDFQRFMHSYGEYAGGGLGVVLGGLGRWGLVRHANRAAATNAREVEELLLRNMSRVNARHGRLGEVWRRGGQGDRPPFVSTPGTRYGISPNPDAAATGELFRPPGGHRLIAPIRGQVTGADLAAASLPIADITFSEVQKARAEQRVAEAQAAAERDPSELNISRLQQARNDVVFWQTMSRFGQGLIGGYAGTGTKVRRRYPRPDLSRADAELANLNRLVAPPPPRPPRRRK